MEADEQTPIAGSRPEGESTWQRFRRWTSSSEITWYLAYVAVVLALAHVSDDMDRLILGVVTVPLSQTLEYGDQSCMTAEGYKNEMEYQRYCTAAIDNETCIEVVVNATQRSVCLWGYNGGGIDYEVLVGPVYYIVFTLSAIGVGLIADVTRRACVLGVTSTGWALFTALTGLVNAYWQLLVLRLLVALLQGTCTPIATSVLGDFFSDDLLATALGIYNWGTDIGYGVAFIIGNYAVANNLGGQGWRWAFYICGIPGIILGIIIFFTIREPTRRQRRKETNVDDEESHNGICSQLGSTMRVALSHFLTCDVFSLCLATALRKAATYSYVYNSQLFYQMLGEDATTIGEYLSWIFLVGGFVGLVIGGYLTDRFSLDGGTSRRLLIVIVCQILAIPFAAGSLLVSTPLSFYLLLPYFMVGEVWLGVSYAALVELVPSKQKTTIVALFVFVVENVAGLGPVFVTFIQSAFYGYGYTSPQALKYALVCTFPGGIGISLIVYIISYISIRFFKET